MADPSAPAIVVGTVDMVGSRLLFEGYGLSRRMRPFAAGLLGCDTLVMLDEAHLCGPFERLLRAIEAGQCPSSAGAFAGPAACRRFPPPFRVLPLSATLGLDSDETPFRLDDDDRANGTVGTRLNARKSLTVEDLQTGAGLANVLAERAWGLMQSQSVVAGTPPAVAVYCARRADAEKVADLLEARGRKEAPGAAVILFVGGRRVHERQEAAEELDQHGLTGDGKAARSDLVFLVATSAGEVGVDLDCDHMVCDLVAWERMVQRLGRVNRRGTGAARLLVIDQGPPDAKKAGADTVARHEAVRALLDALPHDDTGGRQAGPGALVNFATDPAQRAHIDAGTTRMPLYPALTRPLVDAWAMTSLDDHAGRPEVAPWLRGWVEDDEPQTTVVWRRHLPLRFPASGDNVKTPAAREIRAFFAAAPPHTVELLETETSRVADWLKKRTRKQLKELGRVAAPAVEPSTATGDDGADDGKEAAERKRLLAPLTGNGPIAFLLDGANRPAGTLSLAEIGNRRLRDLQASLAGKRLVVDARLGGLKRGLLDDGVDERTLTIEDNWGKRDDESEEHPWTFRVAALSEDDYAGEDWRAVHGVPYCVSAEGEAVSSLVVQKRRGEGESEDARAVARKAQRLEEHQQWAGEEAERIADALRLDPEDRAMLAAAARHHDDGKSAERWQRAFNAPPDWQTNGAYAKTTSSPNQQLLNGFRHEFKSAIDAGRKGLDGIDRTDPRFALALHLIAAHHGHARPAIAVDGYDELPPSQAEAGAHAIALRFAHLQRHWGPWGLAWWEALLRAADQSASRQLEKAAG